MLFVLSLSGCFKMTYTNTASQGVEQEGPQHDVWRHRWIFGMVESQGDLDVEQVCGTSDFTQIHTEVSVINVLADVGVNYIAGALVGGVTAYIDLYSPSTIQVWCGDGTTYLFGMDDGVPVAAAAPVEQELPVGFAFTGDVFEVPDQIGLPQ